MTKTKINKGVNLIKMIKMDHFSSRSKMPRTYLHPQHLEAVHDREPSSAPS